MTTPRLTAVLIFVAGLLAAAKPAAAQCPMGRISSVQVERREVFDTTMTRFGERLSWAMNAANWLHKRTREDVIRRELLFEEGNCYIPGDVADSERILRSMPFLADADLSTELLPDSTVEVLVRTRDEWSTRPELRLDSRGSGIGFRAFEFREDNLAGHGRRVSVYTRESEGERIYGMSYATPQLFETRWDAGFSLGKTSNGLLASAYLAYPFLGETGRWALRQQFLHSDRLLEFWAPREEEPGLARILFGERRQSVDVGAVYRLGRRGNLTLIGGALASEWRTYNAPARFARPEDQVAQSDSILLRFPSQDTIKSIRALLLAGKRNVYFVRRDRLDAVRAEEDVRLGFEIETGIGKTLAFSPDDDISLDVGLYVAGEPVAHVLSGLRFLVEGKRSNRQTGDTWNDIYAQFDGWTYWRPPGDPRGTWVAGVSGVGGWESTVPFQLTLGADTGLRGYPDHVLPGEQRLVGTLEHRRYLPWRWLKPVDLGVAAFADVGRTWRGEDPYGLTSPTESSVGFGLRAAFPRGSRRTYRLDIAFPVGPNRMGRGIGIEIGTGQAIGFDALRDDSQLRRTSRRPLSTSLFNYPN